MIAASLLNLIRPKTPDFVPGSQRYAPLKCLIEMSRDPLGFLTSMHKEYGDVVRMLFVPAPIYLRTQPDLIGRVLLKTEKTNRKSFGYRRLECLLSDEVNNP